MGWGDQEDNCHVNRQVVGGGEGLGRSREQLSCEQASWGRRRKVVQTKRVVNGSGRKEHFASSERWLTDQQQHLSVIIAERCFEEEILALMDLYFDVQ